MDHNSRSSAQDISHVDCLLFDLNDTLYSSKGEISDAFERNIEDFLVNTCGITEDKASTVREDLFITYGTTLAGLKVISALGYDVDTDDYYNFVHKRLPYETVKADMQLRNLLLSIEKRKILFTNSRENHAVKILERLGIQDCFAQIIGFETLNAKLLLLSKSDRPGEFPVIMKPSIEAMKIVLDVVKIDPHRIIFLDNDERNIAAGKAVGLQTILVGKQTKSIEADYAVEKLTALRDVVPQIWDDRNGI